MSIAYLNKKVSVYSADDEYVLYISNKKQTYLLSSINASIFHCLIQALKTKSFLSLESWYSICDQNIEKETFDDMIQEFLQLNIIDINDSF